MAIKAVSQLNRFDNNGSRGTFSIKDSKLHMLSEQTLTNEDKQMQCANNWRTRDDDKWHPQTQYGKTYWNSLIEISKPITPPEDGEGDASIEYESQSITYQHLIENIVWDVKSFLNARNNLSNFDFLSVITQDYTFTGNKTFVNNVTVKGNTYLGDNAASDMVTIRADVTNHGTLTQNGTSQFYVAVTNYGTLTQNGTSYFDTDATFNTWAKIQNLSVHNSAITSCDIVGEHRDVIFDGYAYGLVDRTPNNHSGTLTRTKTVVGTKNGSVPDSLYKQTDRTGDPVCFVAGRPYELTAVNYATNAYNLIKDNGDGWTVGNGEIRTVTGITINTETTSTYKAVYFNNGIPCATNVIDFAEHAYWSDLGERYLADDVYEPGTLVKFGGEKEITIADTEVNAIVSTKAFDLNAGLEGGTVIALCGRVPTKVKGRIEKFDKIMLSDIPGIACKWDGASRVIGRALESNIYEDIKLVECVTRFEI